MLNVNKIYLNRDYRGTKILNSFFIESNEEMMSHNRIKTKLFPTGILTEKEFIALPDQLIINAHNGNFNTNKLGVAIVKDLFCMSSDINIEFDMEYINEVFYRNKKIVNIKVKVEFKDEFIDMNKPLFSGYIDKESKYMINEINGRGPFNIIKVKDFIEVYPMEKLQLDKKYVLNIRYILNK